MHSDPIADLLTRMRNGQRARKAAVTLPYSTLKLQLLSVMKSRKFIANVEKKELEGKPALEVTFSAQHPAMTLTRISKPGRRVYLSSADLRPVCSGLGIAIVSTSQGVMHHIEAKRKGVGGEVLCEIF